MDSKRLANINYVRVKSSNSDNATNSDSNNEIVLFHQVTEEHFKLLQEVYSVNTHLSFRMFKSLLKLLRIHKSVLTFWFRFRRNKDRINSKREGNADILTSSCFNDRVPPISYSNSS